MRNDALDGRRGHVQERLSAYWSRYAAEYDQHQTSRLALPGEWETWSRVWSEVLPQALVPPPPLPAPPPPLLIPRPTLTGRFETPIPPRQTGSSGEQTGSSSELGADPRHVPETSSHQVLDAGTGSGNVALLLGALGYDVTGVDLSEGMLTQARAKLGGHPNPPTFQIGDAVDPPFPPASFDAIVSRYLLWTLRDAPAALARWRELLRPGGVLVAVDGPWFTGAAPLPRRTERERAFADSYDEEAFAHLPFGRAGLGQIVASWETAGFEEVRADPLPEVLELDRAQGVAPGHSPELQFRLSARRPR